MSDTAIAEQNLSTNEADVIDQLAGITPGSRLAELRATKPDVAQFAQGSYLALLEPADPAGVSRFEREAVALRVALLTGNAALADFHRARLHQQDVAAYRISAIETFSAAEGLSPREKAILQHTDLLTREPRASGEAELQGLQAAGLATADIVTVSQLIAFLSFQVRVLAALRALGEE